MNKNNKIQLSSSFLFYTSLFILFLLPLSLSLSFGGVSANYSFVIFPLIYIFYKNNIIVPSQNLLLILSLFFLILLISTLYQFDYLKYLDRRILSFTLFITIFIFLFININNEMVRAFKLSIVLISIYFIILNIVQYFNYGGIELKFEAKALLGSQRYGFIYLLALWITFFYDPPNKLINLIKKISFILIIIGIFLTFSRSSFVSFLLSFLIFFLYSIQLKQIILKKFYINIFKVLISFILIFFVINTYFPITIDFYLSRLINFGYSGVLQNEIILQDPTSSLGFRSFITEKIINFVISNPFTGSGFLGCWIMFENKVCSAHSQYLDVLFRVGIFGFIIYIYLLLFVLKFLKNNHRDLFFGFISVLIYGFFHETFKLSHGGFILSFLIGLAFNKKINNKILN